MIPVVQREGSGSGRPVGRLEGGEPYYAPMGMMRYDGDRVRCHLCGRWLRVVGGWHLIAAHGITTAEYRELFHLFANVSTVAPETAERKRAAMFEQLASGQRDRSVPRPTAAPTVGKWGSLAALHPELVREWHPTRNEALDPSMIGQYSRRKVWWRCSECGNEWQTSPHGRTFAGRGCPACGRRRSIAATVQRDRSFRPAASARSLLSVPTCLWNGTQPATAVLIRMRSRPGPSAGCGGAAARRPADASGRPSWQIEGTASPAVRAACPGALVSDARSPCATDRSRLCTPTCSMSGTPPATATSTPTPSNPDRSEGCGGAARTAVTSGKHHRCRADTARVAAPQPVQSASPAASNPRR
jgi:hypothetical protein